MGNRFYKNIIFICIIDVLVMVYVYPLLDFSAGWTIVTLFNLALVGVALVSKKEYRFNKYAAVWIMSLLPLIFNNYSLRKGEFGFTLLWTFFVLLLLLINGRKSWISPSFNFILVMTGVYAFATILFNVGFTGILSWVAYIFRGGNPINVGTLETAGFTRHYSINGIYIATGFIMVSSVMLVKFNKKNFVITFLFLISLLLTQKRGPLLAALISVIIIYLVTNKHKITTKISILLIGLVFVFGGVYVGYMLFPKLFAVVDRFSTDNMLTDRQYLWHEALVMFESNPLFGVGFGGYPHKLSVTIDTLDVTYINTHNIYLQLLAETGIVGFICFIFPMFFSLINTLKLFRENRTFLSNNTAIILMFSAVMQMFFLVNGITENSLYDRIVYVPYLLSIAYYISIYKQINDKYLRFGDNKEC